MYDGMINVYKEPGYTSHDVVAKLRGILKQKKIGHTGTLDPQAVGVLPVCLGKGTKLCDMLTDRDKTYEVQMLLGVVTDTLDMTGTVLSSQKVFLLDNSDQDCAGAGYEAINIETIVCAVKSFIGTYAQTPPMYSALKVNGKKLYDLAREGITVERKPRMIEIYNIDVKSIEQLDEKISVYMTVQCSKGTYIRSLCDDIGKKLGCGASMGELVRTEAAGFEIQDALKLSQIEELVQKNALDSKIVPVEMAFNEMPQIYLKEESNKYLYNGNPFGLNDTKYVSEKLIKGTKVRVYDDRGTFLAVYMFLGREFRTVKMFL